MTSVTTILGRVAIGALLLFGCRDQERGPVRISVLGNSSTLEDPNAGSLTPAQALLAETTAQGLVRFEASGQIEPGLAQRWIVSDDGLRYTFRLARLEWEGGGKVTAAQVVERLKAATSPASRNSLKSVLGAIAEIEAMTDDVLEITLKSPRPNFLQLLAQPEMAVMRRKKGTGPYRVAPGPQGSILLKAKADDEDSTASSLDQAQVSLRAERPALAVLRFKTGHADLVAGGTLGELPIVRLAGIPARAVRFDPVGGLFGLAFTSRKGILGEAEGRAAISMAIDRQALISGLAVLNLLPRETLLPPGIGEQPQPSAPDWTAIPLETRRENAAATIARLSSDQPVTLSVSLPPGTGYQLALAQIRLDLLAVGVKLRVAPTNADADLQLVDRVAPAAIASWYLRNFTCEANPVCSANADEALAAARIAPTAELRRQSLVEADRLLTEEVVFVPLSAPVRWFLVSDRLTGFQANASGRHAVDQLIAPAR